VKKEREKVARDAMEKSLRLKKWHPKEDFIIRNAFLVSNAKVSLTTMVPLKVPMTRSTARSAIYDTGDQEEEMHTMTKHCLRQIHLMKTLVLDVLAKSLKQRESKPKQDLSTNIVFLASTAGST
jgi:hypothetical protein